MADTRPEWESQEALEEHFRSHGHDLGARTAAEYDQSARGIIETGTCFSYRDRSTGEYRLGYYDRLTGRFTALSEDGDLVRTHFRCDEGYVAHLPENDYE